MMTRFWIMQLAGKKLIRLFAPSQNWRGDATDGADFQPVLYTIDLLRPDYKAHPHMKVCHNLLLCFRLTLVSALTLTCFLLQLFVFTAPISLVFLYVVCYWPPPTAWKAREWESDWSNKG